MATLDTLTMRSARKLERSEGRPSLTWVEQHPRIAIALLAASLIGSMFLEAARRPLWLDELFTFYTTQQPTAGEVIRAIKEGCDGAAPLYALIVRALQHFLGNGPVVLRLPSLAGYVVMCLCVFTFARQRLPALYATVAMLIACNAAWPYATEGRPYGLVLGCAGIALLCWQAACERQQRVLPLVGLGVSLSLGVALHYYALCLAVPFAAGELARWRGRREFDWAVLAVLVTPAFVLIPHLPLLMAARPFMTHFWAKTFPCDLSDFYFLFFGDAVRGWIPAALVVYTVWRLRSEPEGNTAVLYRRAPMAARECLICGAFAVLPVFYLMLTGELEAFWVSTAISVYVAWRYLSRREPPRHHDNFRLMPSHEWAACAALAVLPLLMVVIAYCTIGIFVPRYVLPGVIGVSLVAAATAFRALRGSRMAGMSLLIGLLAWMGARTADTMLTAPPLRDGAPVQHLLIKIPADTAPILVANPLAYMELRFYSEPKLRERLTYAVDPDLDRRYLGNDTIPLILSALRHRIPIHTPDRQEFEATHRRFFLAITPGYEYMASHLRQAGYRITVLERYKTSYLYRVEARTATHAPPSPSANPLRGSHDGV